MPLNEQENFSQNQLELIESGSSTYDFPLNTGDYVKLNIYSEQQSHRVGLNSQIYSDTGFNIVGDFQYIIDATDTVRIKPNDVLDDLGYATGNYNLDLNFLREIWFDLEENLDTEIYRKPKFFVSQISPSRKEVRLFARQLNQDFWPDGDKFDSGEQPIFDNYPLDLNFQNKFKEIVGTLDNNDEYKRYDFKYVLSLGRGSFPVINNYTFDNISDSDFSSLIVKLNEPLPNNIVENSYISMEKELINTQFFSIFYQSEIVSVTVGGALTPDVTVNLDSQVNNQDDTFQNYNELIANSQDISFQNILSEITSSDNNLNIDFTKFKNHTFFGSAESKLKNFKTKIGDLQNNLREISASLGLDAAVSMSGDRTYIKQRRRTLFNNVNDVITSFTPYEKFLYYDSQNSSTASAPGIGSNLAHPVPVANKNDELTTLSSYDGFGVVYKHTAKVIDNPDTGGTGVPTGKVDLFTDKYKVQEAPFFNYSGSVYLSFIIKGHQYINSSSYASGSWDIPDNTPGADGKLTWINRNHDPVGADVPKPQGAFGGRRILNPTLTGSKWQQAIFEVSQSHWQPINGHDIDSNTFDFTNTGAGIYWQLLSGSNITGSGPITAPEGYDTYPEVFTSPETLVTGSIMPMGELFRINYNSSETETTSSFITDVKVTLKNPQHAYPFDYTYKTGSTQWSNWYDTTLSSSIEFDNNNVHSLKNNLPDYIIRDNSFNELHTFVSMIGEHFDLIRNYIDNYNNLTKRNYTQLNSVPGDMLPSIIESFGWNAINPFSGSLDDWFSYSSVGSSRKKVAESTYRKILNNLLYIYKTKGTENSIKALLNCYGYPSDFIPIRLYGGNNEDLESDLVVLTGERQSPRNVTFDAEPIGVTNLIGNKSFEIIKDNHYSYNLVDKTLQFPWWKSEAKGDGIEFIFASKATTNNQSLLISSGSGNRKLWELTLESSGPTTAQLQFKLSNDVTGSNTLISSNSKIMSTPITNFKDGNLWNVYLSRNTNTASNALTQSYNLYAALQDSDKIPIIVSASMTLSSSTNIAAYTGTGSYNGDRNLIAGNNTFSGSLSELRMWSGSLSASTFKMHVLDKHSARGNTLLGNRNKLIYRFRLNENTPSGSTQTIVDSSNPDNIADFSFTDGTVDSNFRYNKRVIEFIRYGIKTDAQSVSSNQRVNINDNEFYFKSNLHPFEKSLTDISEEGRRKTSNKIDISVSSTDTLNKKILTEIGGFDITSKFANPSDSTGSKYEKLESLRNSIMKNVVIDQNKFVRAYKNVFNNAIIDNIKKVLPASSNLTTMGVVVKQDLLDRVKVQSGPKNISRQHYQPITGSISNIFDFSKSLVLNPLATTISASNGLKSSGSVNYSNDATINVMTGSFNLNSNFASIFSTNLGVVNSFSSSIFDNFTGTIQIDKVQLSGSKIDVQYLLDLNSITASVNSQYLKTIDDTILLVDDTDNFILQSSVIHPISGSNLSVVDSSLNITQSIFKPFTGHTLHMLSESLNISSSRLLTNDVSIDLISPTNLRPNFFILNPIIGESIHLASSSLQMSSSLLEQLSGDIDVSRNSDISISSVFEKTYDSTNLQIVSKSIDISSALNTTFDSNIQFITQSLTVGSSIHFPVSSNILNVVSSSFEMSSSYQSSLADTITTSEIYSFNSNIINSYVGDIPPISESLDISGSINNTLNDTISLTDTFTLSSNLNLPNSSSVSLFNYGAPRIKGQEYMEGYGYIKHGKGVNDVHYINFADTGSNGDFNTSRPDLDYVIHSIGDIEIQSSSILQVTGSEIQTGSSQVARYPYAYIDFTDINHFKNRRLISGSNVEYKSYVNVGDGIQKGTPVGRTAYFSASADGTIYYPINHDINFHNVRDQLSNLYVRKNQSSTLGTGNFANGADSIPSASVYSINVVGTDVTRLKVERLNKKNKK